MMMLEGMNQVINGGHISLPPLPLSSSSANIVSTPSTTVPSSSSSKSSSLRSTSTSSSIYNQHYLMIGRAVVTAISEGVELKDGMVNYIEVYTEDTTNGDNEGRVVYILLKGEAQERVSGRIDEGDVLSVRGNPFEWGDSSMGSSNRTITDNPWLVVQREKDITIKKPKDDEIILHSIPSSIQSIEIDEIMLKSFRRGSYRDTMSMSINSHTTTTSDTSITLSTINNCLLTKERYLRQEYDILGKIIEINRYGWITICPILNSSSKDDPTTTTTTSSSTYRHEPIRIFLSHHRLKHLRITRWNPQYLTLLTVIRLHRIVPLFLHRDFVGFTYTMRSSITIEKISTNSNNSTIGMMFDDSSMKIFRKMSPYYHAWRCMLMLKTRMSWETLSIPHTTVSTTSSSSSLSSNRLLSQSEVERVCDFFESQWQSSSTTNSVISPTITTDTKGSTIPPWSYCDYYQRLKLSRRYVVKEFTDSIYNDLYVIRNGYDCEMISSLLPVVSYYMLHTYTDTYHIYLNSLSIDTYHTRCSICDTTSVPHSFYIRSSSLSC